MGVKWTATYSGLDAADVARMADADTRAHWLGRDPLLLNEATIFENAPGTNPPGPAGPGCTRPLEAADVTAPSTPGGFTVFQTSLNQVTLNWTASTDDWYVAGYRIFVDNVAVANTGPTTTSAVVTAAPGPHTYAVARIRHCLTSRRGCRHHHPDLRRVRQPVRQPVRQATTDPLTQADVTAPSVPTDLVAQSGVGTANIDVVRGDRRRRCRRLRHLPRRRPDRHRGRHDVHRERPGRGCLRLHRRRSRCCRQPLGAVGPRQRQRHRGTRHDTSGCPDRVDGDDVA